MLSRTISGLAHRNIGLDGTETSENAPYCWSWPGTNLGKWWLQTPAGKMDPGRVRATSATYSPMLSSTGVNRMAWILPSSGPLMTVAMPEICPRSLILLAAMMKRLESLEMNVVRSVSTLSCQMKPRDQPAELKV